MVDKKLMTNLALAVEAGVSIESGLDAYIVRPKSINSDSFL
jgi:hypothetical protein